MSFDRTLTRKEKSDSLRRAKKDGLCRWCGQDVKRFSKARRTFCSDECVHEYRMRSDTGYMRQQVYKRDKGVCALCGLDCSHWFSEFKRWIRMMPLSSYDPLQRSIKEHAVEEFFLLSGMRPVPNWSHRSTFWDADHHTPVVENGGTCGLEGIRTLCVPCHLEATKRLKERMKDGYYGYTAFDGDVPRYVGIGSRGRWEHVNSGSSHNEQLNSLFNSGVELRIEIVPIKRWKEACEWEKDQIRKHGRKDKGTGTLFNHTDGGDGGNTTEGRMWVHNPSTGESRMLFSVPEGWAKGSGPERIHSLQGVGKGMIYIHNGSQEKKVSPSKPIPDGWIKGRVESHTKGLTWFHSPEGQEGMFETCPEGWASGRSQRGWVWITNGIEQKKHDPEVPVPEGWSLGSTSDGGKGKAWARNPSTGERGKFNEIPEGWIKGKGEVKPYSHRPDLGVFFHNPQTGEIRRTTEPLGTPWIRGMGKRKKRD